MDSHDLWQAAQHLSKTDKGRESMRILIEWFEELGGLSLDHTNQQAVLTLLQGAWGQYAGTAPSFSLLERCESHRVRKPEGIAETEALLRTLVQVPKKELDSQVAKTKAKAQAKHKKRAAKRKGKS